MNIINNPLHAASESDQIGNSKTDDCIICLTNNPKCIKFKGSCKCSPLVHQECLDKWFILNPQICPICRKKYTVNENKKELIQNNQESAQNKQNEECAGCCLCGFIICGILCGILDNN